MDKLLSSADEVPTIGKLADMESMELSSSLLDWQIEQELEFSFKEQLAMNSLPERMRLRKSEGTCPKIPFNELMIMRRADARGAK